MSKLSRHTSLRYKSILFLLSPLALGHVIYRAIKDGGWGYLSQRLGFNYGRPSSRPILIHCASVGEVNAIKPMLSELRNQCPNTCICISTNTPTAARLVVGMRAQNVVHLYLPLDYAVCVNAFLNRVNPVCMLVLETEIWPTLFLLCTSKNIPVAIINGRLTKKSMRAASVIRNDYRRSLQNLALLLTRSDEDRLRFIGIGADKHSTHTVGNLKYTIRPPTRARTPQIKIARPFLLAVSTHDDEEIQLARHAAILKRKNCLLVIAPRYPHRGKKIARQLRDKNLDVAIHSEKNTVTNDTDVYIVDTLGELERYLGEALLVFVGGSLIPRGGHNILEPASLGKCIVTGPHTENFALEVKELLQANGIIQVADNHELGMTLARLLDNERERSYYGMNARRFMEQKKGMTEKYLKYLRPLLNRALHQ